MPVWTSALLWGGVAGGALLLGAALGFGLRIGQRWIAGVMAYGAGVLVSALSFELVEVSYRRGGFVPMVVGVLAGSLLYTGANAALAAKGAKHRKRSGREQPSESNHAGSGVALAIGALIDGIPESAAIGASLISGGRVSWVTVAAVFLSNIPEGLSSSAGMRNAGRSRTYVFALWSGIAVASALASLSGYLALSPASGTATSITLAVAAGGILTMIVETMIPEAVQATHVGSGLVTVLGFLSAYALSRLFGD
jgi:ZIP family zinc transporter